MKKKLFTLLLCAFACISASAWTVSFNEDYSIATITSEANNSNNWGDLKFKIGDAEAVRLEDQTEETKRQWQTWLVNASRLNFIATEDTKITSLEVFQAAKNNGAEFKATTVDFSGAVFAETNEQEIVTDPNTQEQTTQDKVITYTGFDPTKEGDARYVEMTVTPTTNCMSFKYFDNVETAILANVKTLCAATFQNNSKLTTTFTIPASVEFIATLAIDNTPIQSITIPATVKYIANQGFQNSSIRNLYSVEVKGYTYAENGAFDKQTTVGQTDAGYNHYCSLTFPKGASDYFHNSNHTLSQKTTLDPGLFQTWLNEHYNYAATDAHPNGWKEFINSTSTPPTPVPAGEKVVLRTFSDKVARLVPLEFRAYIVTGVTASTVDGKQQYTLNLQQIFAIPANTGVILYGEIAENATYFSMAEIPTWGPGGSSYEAPYNRETGIVNVKDGVNVSTKNYLVPAVESTKIYPFYKDMTDAEWKAFYPDMESEATDATWASIPKVMTAYYNGTGRTTVSDRNFIMSKFKGTSLKEAKDNNLADYVGFFRVKPNVACGPNKAYLSLPADVFDSPDGAEALVVKPTEPADMVFRSDEWNLSVDTGNWGQRGDIGVLQSKFVGEMFFDEDETTGIKDMNAKIVAESDYYTLQGVKVVQPQKGVYVKNGKKVIIK